MTTTLAIEMSQTAASPTTMMPLEGLAAVDEFKAILVGGRKSQRRQWHSDAAWVVSLTIGLSGPRSW
jgi:hypothetical protein